MNDNNTNLIVKLIEQSTKSADAKFDSLEEKMADNKDLHKENHKAITKIIVSVGEINQTMVMNTKSLQEHMRRTDALEQLHIDNQRRIINLERPRIIVKYLKNLFMFIIVPVTALFVLFNAIKSFLN